MCVCVCVCVCVRACVACAKMIQYKLWLLGDDDYVAPPGGWTFYNHFVYIIFVWNKHSLNLPKRCLVQIFQWHVWCVFWLTIVTSRVNGLWRFYVARLETVFLFCWCFLSFSILWNCYSEYVCIYNDTYIFWIRMYLGYVHVLCDYFSRHGRTYTGSRWGQIHWNVFKYKYIGKYLKYKYIGKYLKYKYIGKYLKYFSFSECITISVKVKQIIHRDILFKGIITVLPIRWQTDQC